MELTVLSPESFPWFCLVLTLTPKRHSALCGLCGKIKCRADVQTRTRGALEHLSRRDIAAHLQKRTART